MFGFILVSRGITLSTTYGVQKAMCANTTVVNPCEIPKLTNSKNNDTPVMMSGFMMGMLLVKFITLRMRLFML